MNKTISVNLGGLVFQLDELAFEKLANYLESVREKFSNEEERNEIIQDIEYRIAELFNKAIKDGAKPVIDIETVEAVMQQMGTPTEIEDDGEPDTYTATDKQTLDKAFFRNPDERILGGVLGGIAAYFGWGVGWVRLIFLFLFFFGVPFGGSVTVTLIIAYAIIWVAIPKAKTSSDKLRMKGEPVTIDSITESIKNPLTEEERSQLKKNLSHASNRISEIGISLGNVLAKLIGFGLVFFGIILLIIPVILVGMAFTNFIPGFPGISIITSNAFIGFLGSFALVAVAAVPVLALIFLGLRFIKNPNQPILKTKLRYALLVLFFVAGAVLMGVVLQTVNQFKIETQQTQNFALSNINTDTVYLYNNRILPKGKATISLGNEKIARHNGKLVSTGVQLNIKPTKGGQFLLDEIYTSRGRSEKQANKNIEQINYEFSENADEIVFNNYLDLNQGKWRQQRVQLTLYVPYGKSVKIDDELYGLLNHIETSQQYGTDIYGYIWKATPTGMECENCGPPTPNGVNQLAGNLSATGKAYNFANFNEIELNGFFEVNLIQANEYQVMVNAPNNAYEHLMVKQRGETLEIKSNKKFKLFNNNDFVGTITIALPQLNEIEINGASTVNFGTFNQAKMNIDIAGAAEIVGKEMNVNQLNLDVAGAGDVTFKGNCQRFVADLAGASNLEALGLKTEHVEIDMAGAGTARVYATTYLQADLAGAGDIEYKGNPETNFDKAGLTTITKLDD